MADPGCSAIGTSGIMRSRWRRRATRHSVSRSSPSCANRSSSARSATFPSACFYRAGSIRARTRRLFAEGESRPVRTFSIGYDRDYSTYANELHHARAMAERIGADHHERRLTRDDVIDFLPRMVHLQDEPIADPVCVPVYYVAQARAPTATPSSASSAKARTRCSSAIPNWLQALERQQLDDRPVPRFAKCSRRHRLCASAATTTPGNTSISGAVRAASRCSGAAPNRSRMRRSGGC